MRCIKKRWTCSLTRFCKCTQFRLNALNVHTRIQHSCHEAEKLYKTCLHNVKIAKLTWTCQVKHHYLFLFDTFKVFDSVLTRQQLKLASHSHIFWNGVQHILKWCPLKHDITAFNVIMRLKTKERRVAVKRAILRLQ